MTPKPSYLIESERLMGAERGRLRALLRKAAALAGEMGLPIRAEIEELILTVTKKEHEFAG